MKALVIGATGATGKDLVKQLLNDKDFDEVDVFVRKPLEIQNEKLKTHVVNFEKPDEWKNLVRGDVAFSCLGTTLKDAGSKEAQRKLHFNKITIFKPGMLERKNSERTGEVLGSRIIKFANKLGLFESQKPIPTDILAKAMIKSSKIKSNGYSSIKLGNIFCFAEKTNE